MTWIASQNGWSKFSQWPTTSPLSRRKSKPSGPALGVEVEERVPAGAGEHRGGDQGEPAVVEDGVGAVAAGGVLAFAEQAEAAAGELEDVPGAGDVGLAGGGRLVALVETG